MNQNVDMIPVRNRVRKEIPKQANVTYQLQYRRCGHPGCNQLHGPYWYAYWRDGKSVRSTYIGKAQPAHVQTGLQFAKDV